MRLHYASEKLSNAIRYMACSNATLQKRLEGAHEEFCTLEPADFPEDMSKRHAEILSRLTKEQGSVPSTTVVMSDDEAYEVATLILDLFFAVEESVKNLPLSS